MNIQTIDTVTGSVLDLSKVKGFLYIVGTQDDVLLQSMMSAAVECCEKYIRRNILETTLGLWFDRGEILERMMKDYSIHTPRGRLISVTRISTYEEDGTETVVPVADYFVDNTSEHEGRIHFLVHHDGTRLLNALYIEINVGYETIPQSLIQGMQMLIAHWFENREAYENGIVPKSIQKIWSPERLWRV